jgi:hypothetical protein
VKNDILVLEATSPEELEQNLSAILEEKGIHNSLALLSISGPQVMVRQFELPQLSLHDLKNNLRLEAVELLNLTPNEVEIDYQIIESQDDKIKGIFAAAPRKLLEEYLSILMKVKLIPVTITANILTIVDAFLSRINTQSESFYLLDFATKNTINLAVFDKGHCELIRKISYENTDEAKQEILQSLRYACGRSTCKQPDEVYFSGDLSDKDGLISDLKTEINSKAEQIDLAVGTKESNLSKSYFKINLIKKYAFPLPLRNKISHAFNFAIGISLIIFVIMAIKILKTDSLLKSITKDINSSIKKTNYDYIKSLQEKINLLSNEK